MGRLSRFSWGLAIEITLRLALPRPEQNGKQSHSDFFSDVLTLAEKAWSKTTIGSHRR